MLDIWSQFLPLRTKISKKVQETESSKDSQTMTVMDQKRLFLDWYESFYQNLNIVDLKEKHLIESIPVLPKQILFSEESEFLKIDFSDFSYFEEMKSLLDDVVRAIESHTVFLGIISQNLFRSSPQYSSSDKDLTSSSLKNFSVIINNEVFLSMIVEEKTTSKNLKEFASLIILKKAFPLLYYAAIFEIAKKENFSLEIPEENSKPNSQNLISNCGILFDYGSEEPFFLKKRDSDVPLQNQRKLKVKVRSLTNKSESESFQPRCSDKEAIINFFKLDRKIKEIVKTIENFNLIGNLIDLLPYYKEVRDLARFVEDIELIGGKRFKSFALKNENCVIFSIQLENSLYHKYSIEIEESLIAEKVHMGIKILILKFLNRFAPSVFEAIISLYDVTEKDANPSYPVVTPDEPKLEIQKPILQNRFFISSIEKSNFDFSFFSKEDFTNLVLSEPNIDKAWVNFNIFLKQNYQISAKFGLESIRTGFLVTFDFFEQNKPKFWVNYEVDLHDMRAAIRNAILKLFSSIQISI